MKTVITKESVIAAMQKALENKRTTIKFLKGEITKEQLEQKGIKLAKPL